MRDLDVEAFPTRMDVPDRDGENNDESGSCQTGASEVDEVSDSEQEEAESNLAIPVVQLGTQSLRGGLQSLDMIDLNTERGCAFGCSESRGGTW